MRTSRPFGAILLASALASLLLGACSGADARRDGAAAADRGASKVHLLDQLDGAVVRGDLGGLDGVAAHAGTLLFAADFDALPAFPWFDGRWLGELREDATRPWHADASLVPIEAGRAVAIAPESGGLHAIVAAPADEFLLVSARLRAPATSRGAGIVFRPLTAATPDAAGLAATLLALPQAELAAGRSALLPDDAQGAWRELTLFVPADEGRRSISISLLPSDAGVVVERVEVRRLNATARVHFTPRLAGDGSTHALRRVVDVGQATCDALLVPSGAVVAFELAVPPQRARLRFLPGALGARAGDRVELVVKADGAELWRARRPTQIVDQPAELEPVEVDLAPLAGRRVSIEFAATAAVDAVAFFGVPELLGATTQPRGRNLLLISLDTTRADLLGCYGSDRGLTPNLDAFAAQGTRFDQVVSPSSWTLPTHMSLMSGQHPILHGMIAQPRLMDPVRSRLLAARLRELGWCTAAFTGGGPLVPRNGFGSGFDYYGIDDPCGLTKYDHDKVEVRAARASEKDTLAPVLDWLRAHREQPFFLFVHTFFVHNYYPHPEYLARLADPKAVVAGDQPLVLGEIAMKGDGAALARLRSLYAASLLEVDATFLPRLLGELSALGLDDETIVCILADHGEEHLEHGQFGHRLELFRESTRVPWIMRGPGIPAGVVRRERVDLADVSTTLAALLGLPREPLDFGRDQLAAGAAAEDEDAAHLLVFGPLEQPNSREALEVGPWKIMRWRRASGEPEIRLYRIDDDPLETRDLAAEDPARLRALTAELDRRIADLKEQAADLPGSNVLTRELTSAELERLRGLGYADH